MVILSCDVICNRSAVKLCAYEYEKEWKKKKKKDRTSVKFDQFMRFLWKCLVFQCFQGGFILIMMSPTKTTPPPVTSMFLLQFFCFAFMVVCFYHSLDALKRHLCRRFNSTSNTVISIAKSIMWSLRVKFIAFIWIFFCLCVFSFVFGFIGRKYWQKTKLGTVVFLEQVE